jgi:hypothetical protein
LTLSLYTLTYKYIHYLLTRYSHEKRKTDNNDLIQYLKTVEELKNHISNEEYKKEYRKLRADSIPFIK